MAVRAKFRVTMVSQVDWSEKTRIVKMQPVFASSAEDPNKCWSEATPSGEIEMHITNPAAYDQFQLGKAYYLDFTPAE